MAAISRSNNITAIHREDHDDLSLIYRFDTCRFSPALLLHNTVLASIDTFLFLILDNLFNGQFRRFTGTNYLLSQHKIKFGKSLKTEPGQQN